ncbi:MAG: tRNA (adenosine(37)-N6)-threonylcarbamoyltransferase complex ATPase subunit type 1 TsaE [Acidobacteriaceae bacterium]
MMKFPALTENQIKSLGFDLGRLCRKHDVVLGLSGNLGSGKTTFIKSFAKALNIKKVKSPTFIIVSQYKFDKKNFFHIDFYRLGHIDELQALGLSDIFTLPHRIAVIEWVDKFPSVKKQCDILIDFKIKPNKTRDVTITFNR